MGLWSLRTKKEKEMKKLICLLMVIGFCSIAQADRIQATWEYLEPPPDLMGFTIYVEGDEVWKGIDPLQRTCEITCSLNGEPVNFTITAYDAVNESLPSEAYPLDPTPPAPMSLTVVESE